MARASRSISFSARPMATRMKKACGSSMRLLYVQEVAVVQGLQAQVVELQVALGHQCGPQTLQVELQQPFVQQAVLDALAMKLDKVLAIVGAISACVCSCPRTSRTMVCSSRRAVA
jgi:hypothetical protein